MPKALAKKNTNGIESNARKQQTGEKATKSKGALKANGAKTNVVFMSPDISQFELSKAIYSSGFLTDANLTATSKLVLFGLISHYNHKKTDVFPSQRYLAQQLGISEKSIERAVKELVGEKYIVYTTQKVNHYRFTAFFFDSVKLSGQYRQNVGSGHRQNVGQTYKEENIKNNQQGVKKGFNVAEMPQSGAPQPFSPTKFTQQYRQKTNAYWQNGEISGGTAVPTVEKTRALLDSYREQRKEACSPLDFDREQAQAWLSSFKNDRLHLMNFAVKLRKKHGIQLPDDVRKRLLGAGLIPENYC